MEFISLILIIFIGIFFGIISGLIPGIHINMVSTFILVNISFFGFFEINEIVIFIISMSLTHTFFDFIPSILVGLPNSDTSLSVLPGHKLVLEGKALYAIFLSSFGSLFGGISAIILSVFFYFILETVYLKFKVFVPFVLIISVILLIMTERGIGQKFWGFIIVLFSGGYGLLILNSKLINEPLLILFSGAFGVSTIIYSIFYSENSFPKQNFDIKFKFDKRIIKGLFVGTISSSICSVTPGIGNAQAATLSSLFFKNLSSEIFIIVLGAINTINFVLSIITFYVIERARNGSIYVISQLITKFTIDDVILFFSIIFFVSIISFILTIKLGKFIIKIIADYNLKKIQMFVLILVFIIVFSFDGFYGILGLIGAGFLGLITIILEVKRVHLMSVLIIPVIFNLI